MSLVVFAILMESRDGIVSKSPHDIAAAWQACARCRSVEQLTSLLDHEGRAKFQRWRGRWAQRLQKPSQR